MRLFIELKCLDLAITRATIGKRLFAFSERLPIAPPQRRRRLSQHKQQRDVIVLRGGDFLESADGTSSSDLPIGI